MVASTATTTHRQNKRRAPVLASVPSGSYRPTNVLAMFWFGILLLFPSVPTLAHSGIVLGTDIYEDITTDTTGSGDDGYEREVVCPLDGLVEIIYNTTLEHYVHRNFHDEEEAGTHHERFWWKSSSNSDNADYYEENYVGNNETQSGPQNTSSGLYRRCGCYVDESDDDRVVLNALGDESGRHYFRGNSSSNNNNNNGTNYHYLEVPPITAEICPLEAHSCAIITNSDTTVTKCYILDPRVQLVRNAWPVMWLWFSLLVFSLGTSSVGRHAVNFVVGKVVDACCCLVIRHYANRHIEVDDDSPMISSNRQDGRSAPLDGVENDPAVWSLPIYAEPGPGGVYNHFLVRRIMRREHRERERTLDIEGSFPSGMSSERVMRRRANERAAELMREWRERQESTTAGDNGNETEHGSEQHPATATADRGQNRPRPWSERIPRDTRTPLDDQQQEEQHPGASDWGLGRPRPRRPPPRSARRASERGQWPRGRITPRSDSRRQLVLKLKTKTYRSCHPTARTGSGALEGVGCGAMASPRALDTLVDDHDDFVVGAGACIDEDNDTNNNNYNDGNETCIVCLGPTENGDTTTCKGDHDTTTTQDPLRNIDDDIDDDEAETCIICMVPFQDGDKIGDLPHCNHLYHAKCIKGWITRKNTCPVCLKPMAVIAVRDAPLHR